MNTLEENKKKKNNKRSVKTAFIQHNDKPRLLESMIEVGISMTVKTIQTELLKIIKSVKEKI